MPRIARGETVGGIYHIINRGNMKMQVFDDAEDYEYFFTRSHFPSGNAYKPNPKQNYHKITNGKKQI